MISWKNLKLRTNEYMCKKLAGTGRALTDRRSKSHECANEYQLKYYSCQFVQFVAKVCLFVALNAESFGIHIFESQRVQK